MGCIFMISKSLNNIQQIDTKILTKTENATVESVVLTNPGEESIFYSMKRVYKFLDAWKASHKDSTLLLVVDSGTAKIVHSYFFDMSNKEYESFSVEDGRVWQYSY